MLLPQHLKRFNTNKQRRTYQINFVCLSLLLSRELGVEFNSKWKFESPKMNY